jgi:hypothetical protein
VWKKFSGGCEGRGPVFVAWVFLAGNQVQEQFLDFGELGDFHYLLFGGLSSLLSTDQSFRGQSKTRVLAEKVSAVLSFLVFLSLWC